MKQIALILTLLLAAAGASAQEVFIGADFDTRFDNREHSDCNIDDSHTFLQHAPDPEGRRHLGRKKTDWWWPSICCKTSATKNTSS